MTLYHDRLMDHYRHPRNFKRKLERVDATSDQDNPSCGDKINVTIMVSGDVVADIAFTGVGCALSTASASMTTETVKGKKLADVLSLTKDSVIEIVQLEVNPVRLKCVLLPLEAIQQACKNYFDAKSNKSVAG